MRFAYLDNGDPRSDRSDSYESTSTLSSTKAEERLRIHAVDLLGSAGSPRCVFAGMGYHLDWLFSALSTAGTSLAWAGGKPLPPSQPVASHEAEAGLKNLHTDFLPLNGSQKDLLAYCQRDSRAMFQLTYAFDPAQNRLAHVMD